jgi:hypothetical protein
MSSITNSIRGTVQGVVGATAHVLWWVRWQTGGPGAVRPAPQRQSARA